MTEFFLEFAAAADPHNFDFRILRAMDQIHSDYGDNASIVRKKKLLHKFGESTSVDSSSSRTIWKGDVLNNENPLFGDPSLGNVLDTIVCDTADTVTLRVEGHTKSGDDLTFVAQDVTLTGTTEAPLATPLHTCTRIVNLSSTALTGDVYVFDNADGSAAGTPNDPTDIGGYVAAGDQQTQQAFTAVSSLDYWILTAIVADVEKANAANVDVTFEQRSTAGVWLPMYLNLAVSTTGSSTVVVDLDPCIIIPKNTYIRAKAFGSSATDTTASVSMSGYLALIVG